MALMLFRTHNMNGGPGHCQLARSLERILEEAQLSGELKLSNRKLKEFPRTATKYNLGDTVIADLSRNRFCELPEDITSYAFLETLLLYHNTIRSIPQSVKGLTSLTYLDLRSNHLISLPREICFLPLQVLLVAHNRLTSLPDELGRMEKLTDLDVSCNQIGNLPTRIGDLKNLRSLSLRSNQLIYLPREITFLSLISLDISNNRISGLPNEIRQMTTLVSLKLDNNPLTSPPASLCIRGLVHILKFLETQALNDKVKCGPTVDGFATLRRAPRNPPSTIDDKLRRHHVDSGYSTSDGLDKRWSQDNAGGVVKNGLFSSKTSPLEKVITDAEPTALASVKLEKEFANNAKDSEFVEQRIDMNNFNYTSNNNSENTSPDEEIPLEGPKLEGKSKSLCNIQTYREYKEALKQQRNQEIQNVYRTKSQPKVSNDSSNNANKCSENLTSDTFVKMNGLNQDVSSYKHDLECNFALPLKNGNTYEDSLNQLKKPIQKVPPSRNLKKSKVDENKADSDNECCDYIKPSSPVKCNGVLPSNYTFNSNKTETPPRGTKLKLSRNVSWNQDSSSEKLSFTMRREFDKQKEETELIAQLRSIIETRLKMNLPEDIASALTDGVILCHLANYVRPRSVASIHVPSPGVPKLTMARCRRNVDNFLEACRKIGVDEELICSCADVVSNKETVEECLPNLKAVYRTISALLSLVHGHGPQHGQGDPSTSATNSNKTGQPEAEVDQSPSAQNGNGFNGTSFADNEVKSNDNRDETGLSTEFMEHFTAMCSSENGSVNIIFNTKEVCCCNNDFTDKTYYKPDIDLVDNGNYSNDEETKVTDRENFQRNEILIVNNLNAPKAHSQSFDYKNSSNLNINNEKNAPQKIVTKRIEFFERNTCGKANNDRSIFSIYNPSLDHQRKTSRGQDSLVLTIFLSSIFIITFLLLIIFPLPN